MKTIRDLLRNTDPLGYESQPPDRDFRRQARLISESDVNPGSVNSVRLPIALLAIVVLALIAGATIAPRTRDGAVGELQAPVRFETGRTEDQPAGIVPETPLQTTTAQEAYRPGNGVSSPQLLKEVKALYTPQARRARIEGAVLLDCVVLADGKVASDVKVVRSLDSKFGLDQEAAKAARQWLFKPGMKGNRPVPVRVTIEITFSLSD